MTVAARIGRTVAVRVEVRVEVSDEATLATMNDSSYSDAVLAAVNQSVS